jgi:hypothetical protein
MNLPVVVASSSTLIAASGARGSYRFLEFFNGADLADARTDACAIIAIAQTGRRTWRRIKRC